VKGSENVEGRWLDQEADGILSKGEERERVCERERERERKRDMSAEDKEGVARSGLTGERRWGAISQGSNN
jgi:hypothetical protein